MTIADPSTPPQVPIVSARPELEPVTVVIVDDNLDSSYALWALLNWEPGIRVATATSAAAIAVVQLERPDVCLVSASLGLRCVHQLTQLPARPRVLIYSDRQDAGLDGAAVIAGADGVFWRYGDTEELEAEIRRVAAGQRSLPDIPREEVRRLIDRVEDRDRSIAAMMLLHFPPDEIARTAGISARALEARRCALVRRLA
jgi:DNA-binding NarL/FixJ family response regulator